MIQYQAIPVTVNGHKAIGLEADAVTYRSKLEGRMARLLIQNLVRFTPHVKFNCILPTGERFSYELDFLLEVPCKFQGITHFVSGIEVKGVLRPFDFMRVEALKFCHRVRTFVVTEPLIILWETSGLFIKE